MHRLVATPVTGPLTADQLTAILKTYRSIHQFQAFDQFSVVYISERLSLQLDKGGMESVVEYLESTNSSCKRTQLLRNMADRLVVRPILEPEVKAAMSRPEPDPEPIFEVGTPKFVARLRFNLRNGRREEKTLAIDNLRELDFLLDRGPYDDDIKNIKIKLEIQR